MTKKTDRRKPKRVALFDDFHVLDSKTSELLGYVRDIASRGMMVVGTLAPIVDQVYRIAVVLPEPILESKILQLEATCRWHMIDVQRGFHKSGFQFGVLAFREEHMVEQIQADYEFSVSEGGE